MDDDSSIYVGGLPYDATEETIRTVFNLYGAILDVKVHFSNSISFRVLTNLVFRHFVYLIPFTNNRFNSLGFRFNCHVFFFQIINDPRTRGKCYCFVTFTNPRSAIDAINDMNGRVCNLIIYLLLHVLGSLIFGYE